MNRDESIGRMICQAMKHFAEDSDNFKAASSEDNYPIPLVLDKNRYFLGFCKHKEN
jgi:hypothetical protein